MIPTINYIMSNLNEKTFDLLETSGLNWTVTKEELLTNDGKSTESFGIFRSDNDQWLGTVGNRYTPMQNFELAETIIQASDGLNLPTKNGGVFGGGKKVFIQVELPTEQIGVGGVKRWITALNSNDGSTSIGFGSTSQVIKCSNTFHMAHKGLDKFRHTASASARVQMAMQDLRKAMQLDNSLMDNFKRMADIELKDEMIESVIRKMFNVDPMIKQDAVSTRKRNQVETFAQSLTTEIHLEGKTLWGLFNGVTRFTNHDSKTFKSIEDKNEYLMSGGGFKTSNVAFNDIMKWVEKHTIQYV
jgi:phage/plasmid-like protein (TIGR03299 family)